MPRPRLARDRLIEIPAGTELLRSIRYMADDELADCSGDELAAAVRWLRAAAYSANEGARRLEQILHRRHLADDPSPTE